MKRTVLVRYGELSLKSEPVRREFKDTLIENIRFMLKDLPSSISYERGRIFIETSTPRKVASRVSKVPGVVSTSPAWRTESNLEDISEVSEKITLSEFSPGESFAVRPRRKGNHEFDSQDIGERIGNVVLESNPDMSVDLDDPDNELGVEVRDDYAYIFTEVFEGVGGLPVGTQGKVVSLFSGGIRSLMSSFLMMKRGNTVLPLVFETEGVRDGGYGVVKSDLEKLGDFHHELEFVTISFQDIYDNISEEVPRKLRKLVCKRFSFRFAESLAKEIGAKALVSDESLDQLCEQGLRETKIVEDKVDIPVLYPLSGFTEGEVMEMGEDLFRGKRPEMTNHHCSSRFPGSTDIDLARIKEAEEEISENFLSESSLGSIEIRRLEENE